MANLLGGFQFCQCPNRKAAHFTCQQKLHGQLSWLN